MEKSGKKQKKSLYIPEKYLNEMVREAKRQERSLSWIVKHAWLIARDDIQSLPAVADFGKSPKDPF